MPNRVLRDWTASENVDALSQAAEIFFVRLIMVVDDFGTSNANPKLLNAALFPLKDYTTDQINIWLAELVRQNIVVVYEAEGKTYLQINDFNQRLRRMKPKHPLPNDEGSRTIDGQPSDVRPLETKQETETETETESNTNGASSKPSLDDRKLKFGNELKQYLPEYGEEMLFAFFDYWTEHNPKGRKMRFEMEKVFNVERRLRTWSSRNKTSGGFVKTSTKKQGNGVDADYMAELLQRING